MSTRLCGLLYRIYWRGHYYLYSLDTQICFNVAHSISPFIRYFMASRQFHIDSTRVAQCIETFSLGWDVHLIIVIHICPLLILLLICKVFVPISDVCQSPMLGNSADITVRATAAIMTGQAVFAKVQRH